VTILLAVLVTLLLLYLGALFALSWISLHPIRTPIFLAPAAFDAPQENVEFSNGHGQVLRGWWMPVPEAKTVAVFAHGYVMNRAEMIPVAARLWKLGVASLAFDFRAHGRSTGRKSGLGHYEKEDVAAAVAWARTQSPGAKVVLLGSSMGAAASALALGADPSLADALVLDSSYSKLSNAIPGWWRFIGGRFLAFVFTPVTLVAIPLAGFSPFRVDVAAALRKAPGKPVLLLHGDEDDLALPSEATRNQEACGGELVWLTKCGHTEGRWVHPELYMTTLVDFLRKHQLL
jgi:uncharacterized protein